MGAGAVDIADNESLVATDLSAHTECQRNSETKRINKRNNLNKKHLKNVGPIRHCEPPHAHSKDVASGTVARRLRIDVHDIDNDNDDNDNA